MRASGRACRATRGTRPWRPQPPRQTRTASSAAAWTARPASPAHRGAEGVEWGPVALEGGGAVWTVPRALLQGARGACSRWPAAAVRCTLAAPLRPCAHRVHHVDPSRRLAVHELAVDQQLDLGLHSGAVGRWAQAHEAARRAKQRALAPRLADVGNRGARRITAAPTRTTGPPAAALSGREDSARQEEGAAQGPARRPSAGRVARIASGSMAAVVEVIQNQSPHMYERFKAVSAPDRSPQIASAVKCIPRRGPRSMGDTAK